MSNFTRKTYNPKTGVYEDADWIDNYFGPHEYGVKYQSGFSTVYKGIVIEIIAMNDKMPVFEEEKNDD